MANRKKVLLNIFIGLIFLIIISMTYYYIDKVRRIAYPFVMGIVIAYLLKPIVEKMEKRINKSLSILILYSLFAVFVSSALIYFIPEIINNTREFIDVMPSVTYSYQNKIDGVLVKIQMSEWPIDVKNTIFREVQNSIMSLQEWFITTIKKLMGTCMKNVSMIFDVILSFIIAYYLIIDSEDFKKMLLVIVPKKWKNDLIGGGREINMILKKFIQGQVLTAIIVGIIEFIGLYFLKIKYAMVLGIIGGFANIIPYFGPIIAAVPATIVALIDTPMKALWVLVLFIVVQQIDNIYISPKIIEGGLGLHPVTTILAILIGEEFFGIIGMLVSVPITAILKVVFKRTIEAIV